MRVLRVITRLDVHGGAELSTLIEMEELAVRGHDVLVVTLSEPTTDAAVERLEAAGIGRLHLASGMIGQIAGLRRLIKRWCPDVVHAVIFRSEVVVAIATLGLRVATVVSLVNMQYATEAVAAAPSPRRLELIRRFEGLVLRRGIDHFHCLTVAGSDHSVQYLGIDPSEITVIPRGRRRSDGDVEEDRVRSLREHLAPDGSMVVNVGRHEQQKGQDLLVDVVRRLPSGGPAAHVVIAGREGNDTAELRDAIDSAGLSDTVELLGARTDVAELLRAADVVCVTSRWEGLGGSIIEALYAGAPIVAFGVPAVAEVIGGAGVLVVPFDTASFAEELDGVLRDAALRRNLSELARRRFAELFEIGPVVDRVESMYEGLVRRDGVVERS